jgi:hypothetical protein
MGPGKGCFKRGASLHHGQAGHNILEARTLEEAEVGVMETRQRLLGEKDPDTLTNINNLAFTWPEFGGWDVKTLDWPEAFSWFGTSYTITLFCMSRHVHQGKLEITHASLTATPSKAVATEPAINSLLEESSSPPLPIELSLPLENGLMICHLWRKKRTCLGMCRFSRLTYLFSCINSITAR